MFAAGSMIAHERAVGAHTLVGDAPESPAAISRVHAERTGDAPPIDRPQDRLRIMVDTHFEFIWRSLRGLGVAAAHADDSCQQVFLIASKKLDVIAAGSERAFLFATARGVAANARRSVARSRELPDEVALASEVDHAPNPEQSLVRVEAKKILEGILEGMQEDARTVFVLFEIEGLTTAEIAELLALPMGTVASRLRRAREHFERETARVQAGRGT